MSERDRMPERIGPYRLIDRIGEGGMGVVYLAADGEQRSVALKVLRPAVAGDPTARLRLAREVETMRRVRSPHVADVIDADLTGDPPYIVTRYVPGRTLDDLVAAGGPLQGPALAALARGLAEALTAVHQAGVVHRDLKPGNVMLVNGSPVVIDFGIAQGIDTTRLTMTGMFMGTPGYLSPEVIEGHPSSAASDVHAWAATVAFAATGRPPFGTGPYETIFYRIVNGSPDLAGVPAPLMPLLSAALARVPDHRPSADILSRRARSLEPGSLVPLPAPAGGPGGGVHGAQATQADLAPGGPPSAVQEGAPGPAPDAPGQAAPARLVIGSDGGPAAPPGPPGPAGGLAGPGEHWNGSGPPGALPAGAAPLVPTNPGPAQMPPGTRPFAAVSPADEFSDLLPPVSYPAAVPARSRAAGPGTAGTGGKFGFGTRAADARRGHLVPVVAAVLVIAGLSVLFPVAGTVTAVAAIVALRAGESAHAAAVRRRSRAGGASGSFMTVLSYPWFLFRSLLACLVLVPFAVAAGAVASGVAIAMPPGEPVPRALAFGAGVLVAFYGAGPGSSRSRRQLGRLFSRLTRTRLTWAVTVAAMVLVAVATIAAALTWPSLYWPAAPPGGSVPIGAASGGLVHHLGQMARYLLTYLTGG